MSRPWMKTAIELHEEGGIRHSHCSLQPKLSISLVFGLFGSKQIGTRSAGRRLTSQGSLACQGIQGVARRPLPGWVRFTQQNFYSDARSGGARFCRFGLHIEAFGGNLDLAFICFGNIACVKAQARAHDATMQPIGLVKSWRRRMLGIDCHVRLPTIRFHSVCFLHLCEMPISCRRASRE